MATSFFFPFTILIHVLGLMAVRPKGESDKGNQSQADVCTRFPALDWMFTVF